MESVGQNDLGFLVRLAARRRGLLAAAIVCSVVAGLATFVPYAMVARTIMVLFEPAHDVGQVTLYGLAAVGAIAVRFAASGVSAACTHKAAYETLYQVRRDVCAHLGDVELGFFTENSLGEVRKVLMEDVERLEEFLAHQIPDIVVAMVVPTTVLAYLFALNVPMALMLLVPVVLTMLTQAVMLRAAKKGMGSFYAVAARLASAVLQFIHGMPVMKSFNLTTDSYEAYSRAVHDYNAAWWHVARWAAPLSAVCSVVVESGIAFMIPLGGLLYLRGDLALADYVFFILMSIVFLSSYNNLMNFAQLYSQVAAGVGRIRQMLAVPGQRWGAFEADRCEPCEVAFREVGFSYGGGGEREVLSDATMRLKPGTLTAFVGPSGAGKSTAAQLIPRFWDATHGQVLLAGRPLAAYTRESLMDCVSFVFQDAFVLDDTVFANIAIGRADSTRDQVESAARAAQIHDFVCSLPQGYDTHLGSAGVKLSGGERQRLCIARAILKDAPVIVFDEATSFTDMENERKIQRALGNLLVGKTCVMIAHRLHTIVDADEICVFEDGRIVERGRHDVLAGADGAYARMWASYGKAV